MKTVLIIKKMAARKQRGYMSKNKQNYILDVNYV